MAGRLLPSRAVAASRGRRLRCGLVMFDPATDEPERGNTVGDSVNAAPLVPFR